MFGRKVMTFDFAKNRDNNRFFKMLERDWVPCDFVQIGRETKRHDRVRVTFRRRRFGEKSLKPKGMVSTFLMSKRPKDPGKESGQS